MLPTLFTLSGCFERLHIEQSRGFDFEKTSYVFGVIIVNNNNIINCSNCACAFLVLVIEFQVTDFLWFIFEE